MKFPLTPLELRAGIQEAAATKGKKLTKETIGKRKTHPSEELAKKCQTKNRLDFNVSIQPHISPPRKKSVSPINTNSPGIIFSPLVGIKLNPSDFTTPSLISTGMVPTSSSSNNNKNRTGSSQKQTIQDTYNSCFKHCFDHFNEKDGDSSDVDYNNQDYSNSLTAVNGFVTEQNIVDDSIAKNDTEKDIKPRQSKGFNFDDIFEYEEGEDNSGDTWEYIDGGKVNLHHIKTCIPDNFEMPEPKDNKLPFNNIDNPGD